jgi:hypothetical protein
MLFPAVGAIPSLYHTNENLQFATHAGLRGVTETQGTQSFDCACAPSQCLSEYGNPVGTIALACPLSLGIGS